MNQPTLRIVPFDALTSAIFLEVPDERVVLLQALFESYEGIASVRTLGVNPPVVCILTTTSMVDTVCALLHDIHAQIPWRPADASRELLPFE